MIRTILVDLGNVLIDFDHTIAAKRISQFCGKTPQEIFDLFFASDVTMRFEAGTISPQEFYLGVKEMLDLRLSFDSFVPIWNDIFFLTAKNRAAYSLMNTLKDNYRVALISNINVLHYEYLQKRYPVFNVFHEVFTSCALGCVKPDHAIYRKTLEALGSEPQDVFYTDDREDLVESARQLGIHGFVFKDVETLKADLLGAGVTI